MYARMAVAGHHISHSCVTKTGTSPANYAVGGMFDQPATCSIHAAPARTYTRFRGSCVIMSLAGVKREREMGGSTGDQSGNLFKIN